MLLATPWGSVAFEVSAIGVILSAILQKILNLRMFLDIRFDKWAARNHSQALGADEIKRALGQLRADTLAAQFFRHLGMRESDHASCERIGRDRGVTFDLKFKLLFGGIVGDRGHDDPMGLREIIDRVR